MQDWVVYPFSAIYHANQLLKGVKRINMTLNTATDRDRVFRRHLRKAGQALGVSHACLHPRQFFFHSNLDTRGNLE